MAPGWANQPRNAQRGAQRQKPPLTHFLCVPIVTAASRPVLEAALVHFRDEARKVAAASPPPAPAGLFEREGGAVRPVGTLHLTLGVMSLLGAERVAEAVRLLERLDLGKMLEVASAGITSTGQNAPLIVAFESLHAMGSPASTSTLFMAPMDATERLRPFCEALKRLFVEKGLMVEDDRPLKLHVTVLNTIYARPGGRQGIGANARAGDVERKNEKVGNADGQAKIDTHETGGMTNEKSNRRNHNQEDASSQNTQRKTARDRIDDNKSWKRQRSGPTPFDARPIMNKFKDVEWAKDLKLDRVAICKMGAQKTLDASGKVVDEAYEEIFIRKLPT